MKFLGFRFSVCLLVLAVLGSLGLAACGGGSNASTNPPPKPGSMAGAWDFTVVAGTNPHPIALEAILTQDSSGNISGTGSVTASGPAGNTFEADIFGSSLSTATDMAVDYLGNTCNGADSGSRTVTGTISSSNQVTLTLNDGGAFTATIQGTLNASATPPFSGTVTLSGVCATGGNPSATGVLASSLTGSYSGVSASDSTETITISLTDTNASLTANGTDSKLGSFTLTGTAIGNAFSATITFPNSPGNNGPVFGYFDPQLGAKGSILLTSFQGGSATTCPSGTPIDNGSCLIGILAKQ
jgi:surface adhesion protein